MQAVPRGSANLREVFMLRVRTGGITLRADHSQPSLVLEVTD